MDRRPPDNGTLRCQRQIVAICLRGVRAVWRDLPAVRPRHHRAMPRRQRLLVAALVEAALPSTFPAPVLRARGAGLVPQSEVTVSSRAVVMVRRVGAVVPITVSRVTGMAVTAVEKTDWAARRAW